MLRVSPLGVSQNALKLYMITSIYCVSTFSSSLFQVLLKPFAKLLSSLALCYLLHTFITDISINLNLYWLNHPSGKSHGQKVMK